MQSLPLPHQISMDILWLNVTQNASFLSKKKIPCHNTCFSIWKAKNQKNPTNKERTQNSYINQAWCLE